MGDGDDRFTRTVADGIDRVEGGAGVDQLSASGTESDDFIEVQGLLARTRLLLRLHRLGRHGRRRAHLA